MIKNKTATISLILFFCFLCVYGVNAYLNYDGSFVDDMVIYLKSSHALLHGKMTIDQPIYDLLKSRFPDMRQTLTPLVVNPSGQLVSIVSIGITLLIAPFLALFGENAAWIVRILWDICLCIGLFFTVYEFYKDRDNRIAWVLALVAIAAYGTVINFRLTLRRDIACAALLSLATLFAVLGANKKRDGFWLASFGLLCFICTIKLTLAILFAPFVLYFVKSGNVARLRPKFIIIALAIFVVIAIPFCIQNHVGSGHWYEPAQFASAIPAQKSLTHMQNPVKQIIASIVDICKAQAYIYSPKGLPKWLALPFVGMALWGMWLQRKAAFVRWWVIPTVVVQYAFMVYWFVPCTNYAYTYNVYLSPAYPLMAFCFVFGLYSLIARLKQRTIVLWACAAVFLLPFFAVKLYRCLPHHQYAHFRLPQIRHLVGDCEAVIAPHSAVLCDAFLCFPLDYYSNSSYFPPSRLVDSSSTVSEKLSFLLSKNVAVYFCDYRGIEGSYTLEPELEKEFMFTLVKKDQQYYNHPNEFPVAPFNIYRLSVKQ